MLVELADGTLHGFIFVAGEEAARAYAACGEEWKDGRHVVFYVPRWWGMANVVLAGSFVASIELVDSEQADTRGVSCMPAVYYGAEGRPNSTGR